MSDADLIAELNHLVTCERKGTGLVLRSLMEFDARRLYLGLGYSSLFGYCTQALHYAEHAALNRIEVARAARRLPHLLEHIEVGSLNITAARLLAPHLTVENVERLLAAAAHKSKREIEEMIAALHPRPAAAPSVRKLPSPAPRATDKPATASKQSTAPDASPPGSVSPAAPLTYRPSLTPLSPERCKVQFTITRDTRDRLRQVQDLMRHINPNGDPAVIFDRALILLLAELHRSRCAATPKPRTSRTARSTSRHIPAAVKREVWRRDHGRCAFLGTGGACGERGFLELHHVVPFAAGGEATAANIELRCRAHNAYEASLFFATDGAGEVRERRGLGVPAEFGP
jgi:5-methylcytosine-specific restriction endonuclease McrA